MKRGLFALIVLVLAAGACQPDQPRREQRQDTDRPQSSRSGEVDDGEPQPVRYQIFNREDVAEPARTTLHLMVDAQATRGELRVTLAEAINRAVEADSSLVALRAVGYVGTPSTRGPRDADLVPIAWAEWIPPSGWSDATAEDLDAVRRLYFYHGSPPDWQQ